MTSDLAALAERRAGLAALLGLLLIEEPGPELGDLVGGHPSLAPLASGDPAIAGDYERIFLRGVAPYESVFRSDDGQQGGPVLAELLATYERIGYDEFRDGRWRVAGADHLGLELRCLAGLCLAEAAAWRDDDPAHAVEAVDNERRFLADHLSRWAQPALDAAAAFADGSPYLAVIEATSEFLAAEHDRLRPRPVLGAIEPPAPLPTNLGPARLARLLLAPASAGCWLSRDAVSRAADAIGSPWRPSDTRSALRHLVQAAEDSGDLRALLAPVGDDVGRAVVAHRRRAELDSGNELTWREWEGRAQAMLALIEAIAARDRLSAATPAVAERLIISGGDAAALAAFVDSVVDAAREAGFDIERDGRD